MKDQFGDRMKSYENVWKQKFPDRLPVIIRVDGKAFHTFTRGFEKPFAPEITRAMDLAAEALVKEIQGARLAYTQSDEISVLLYPWRANESQAWFGNELQKMVSVAASIAAVTFTLNTGVFKPAFFDARAFVLPSVEEAANCFLWRTKDCVRNSISAVAQANFSHKELQGKSQRDMLEMLESKDPWAEYDAMLRNGRIIMHDGRTLSAVNEFPWWNARILSSIPDSEG